MSWQYIQLYLSLFLIALYIIQLWDAFQFPKFSDLISTSIKVMIASSYIFEEDKAKTARVSTLGYNKEQA